MPNSTTFLAKVSGAIGRCSEIICCSLPVFCSGFFLMQNSAVAQTIDRLDTIGPYISTCMTPKMVGQRFDGRREVNLRVAFRSNGSMIGPATQTFSFPPASGDQQAQFIISVKQAFVACTPLPFSKALGEAIAGRPYNYRYIHQPSKDIRI
jgi:hypothetical protein